MEDTPPRDWLEDSRRHDMTCICERALKVAAEVTWHRLERIAATGMGALGDDHYDPTRSIIAAYLRQTGRVVEAAEVEAIGCNEPPPRTGFGALTAQQRAELRDALRGGDTPG
jgi:hypothetical protein